MQNDWVQAVVLSREQFVCTHAGAAAFPLCGLSCAGTETGAAMQTLGLSRSCLPYWHPPRAGIALISWDQSSPTRAISMFSSCCPDSCGSWLSCCVLTAQLKLFSQPHMSQQINQTITPWVISNLLKAIGNAVVPAPFLWPLIRGGYCSEWGAGCAVTLSQNRQLQVAVGVFLPAPHYIKSWCCNPNWQY